MGLIVCLYVLQDIYAINLRRTRTDQTPGTRVHLEKVMCVCSSSPQL